MQNPVVSNSSPIIHLAKIDQLNLLNEFYGDILIPEAVYYECVSEGKKHPEVSRIKQATWLQVMPVTNKDLVKLLNSEVDHGESEAITLALETDASLILLDDADARQKARLYQLRITGTLGLLLRAKICEKIDSLSQLLLALRKTGFWITIELENRLLTEAGERENK